LDRNLEFFQGGCNATSIRRFPGTKARITEFPGNVIGITKLYTRRLRRKIRDFRGEFPDKAARIGTKNHCQSLELIALDGADIAGWERPRKAEFLPAWLASQGTFLGGH
jgi:hypothetical protein